MRPRGSSRRGTKKERRERGGVGGWRSWRARREEGDRRRDLGYCYRRPQARAGGKPRSRMKEGRAERPIPIIIPVLDLHDIQVGHISKDVSERIIVDPSLAARFCCMQCVKPPLSASSYPERPTQLPRHGISICIICNKLGQEPLKLFVRQCCAESGVIRCIGSQPGASSGCLGAWSLKWVR